MTRKVQKKVARSERVEMRFLEALRGRCPGNGRILEALGELYTKTGRYEDGLKVDMELTRMNPREAVAWYNLACSYALVDHRDDAFAALNKAVDLGYRDFEWMKQDEDLESLHGDARFNALLKRAAL